MVVERMRAAIADAWTFAQADELARGICRALTDEALTEQDERDLQGLLEALHARRAEIRARAGGTKTEGEDAPRRRSIFPERAYRPIPDLPASRKRARHLAASGPLPPGLAASFSVSHLAALRIVADEVARTGTCRLHVEAIAARAGISRRSVQYAMKEAERAGLLAVKERARKGQPHLTNLIHVTSPEWGAWIEKGKRPGLNGKPANFDDTAQSFAPHGQASSSEPLAPRHALRATGEERAGPEWAGRSGGATAETGQGKTGPMPRAHTVVRHSERPTPYPKAPGRAHTPNARAEWDPTKTVTPSFPLPIPGTEGWRLPRLPSLAGPGAHPSAARHTGLKSDYDANPPSRAHRG